MPGILMHLAGEGWVWGGVAVLWNPKGPETLLSWPRAPWVDPRDRFLGREPIPPQGRPCTRLLQPPALGPTWWLLDLGPRMEDTGWTVCGPAGEVLWVLLQTAQGGRGETESTWAGTWKELTQPHVATEPTSLRDSTGPHDGLKAPALRGTEGALWALSSPGTGTSPSEKQAGRQWAQLRCWDPWAHVACRPLPPRPSGPGPLAQVALSPPARRAQLEHAGRALPSWWGLRQRPRPWASQAGTRHTQDSGI